METNKTILLREVISIEDRKPIGSVKDLCVDCDRSAVSHYVVGDASLSNLRLLPCDKVIGVGDSFVTIGSEAVLVSPENRASKKLIEEGCRLVGTEVFSRTGNRVGSVAGYEFDTETGRITRIDTADRSYAAENVLFISPDHVFVTDGSSEAASGEPAQAAKSAVREPQSPKKPEPASEPVQPAKTADESQALRELLIGGKVTEDIVSKDGKFKLSKGSVITEDVLAEAQEHEAVLLLTMSVDV
ncbi:hypothetical protein [Raoultibacter phocaeensis]|uniref:PRC-barrel domain-containing protein n=1 Tax=Raoultibacter phocaeensis TaxID=2479841 RepID=UPI00111981A9|nr:hypothetical protein [Raoultibacter phocaeensis]